MSQKGTPAEIVRKGLVSNMAWQKSRLLHSGHAAAGERRLDRGCKRRTCLGVVNRNAENFARHKRLGVAGVIRESVEKIAIFRIRERQAAIEKEGRRLITYTW